MKLMVTDWRNPGRWSMADRKRDCRRASISNEWDRDPFGIRPVETLVALQPGVLFYDDKVAGRAGGFNQELGEISQSQDLWLYNPAGAVVKLWELGPQEVRALDLTKESTRRLWTAMASDRFHFADGLHLDYFGTLAWIDNTFHPSFWQNWFEAWRDVVDRLRILRPDWCLIGQEWHLTPITDKVDGLFLEDNPTQFGLTFDEIRRQSSLHGHPEDWVLELRYPDRFPLDYRRRVVSFAASMGCFVSWRRDALAGVGFPP